MKTIQQRADDYVGHPEEIDEFSYATIKRQAFIDGAKAQKRIDIDKACEWLKNNYRNLDYINYEGDLFDLTLVKDFRKAMEDEIWR